MMFTRLKTLTVNILLFLLVLTSCTTGNYQNNLKVQYPEIEHTKDSSEFEYLYNMGCVS